MYEELKKKYDKGYITKATLKGWVRIERKVKGRGITEEQYERNGFMLARATVHRKHSDNNNTDYRIKRNIPGSCWWISD